MPRAAAPSLFLRCIGDAAPWHKSKDRFALKQFIGNYSDEQCKKLTSSPSSSFSLFQEHEHKALNAKPGRIPPFSPFSKIAQKVPCYARNCRSHPRRYLEKFLRHSPLTILTLLQVDVVQFDMDAPQRIVKVVYPSSAFPS